MMDVTKLKKIEDCRGRIKEIVGNDAAIKLAMDGILPHYIITNPITKEDSLWFLPSEINKWFDDNFIKYRQGYFNKSNDNIPFQLRRAPELYHLPLRHILTPPGVYFLCKDGEIQYIGKALNISARILTHTTERVKDFNSVFFIPIPLSELSETERSLISYIRPPLNMRMKKVPEKSDVDIVRKVLNDVFK